MEKIKISQVKDFLNKEIKIQGWVRNTRSSGKLIFLEIRDGTGEIQGIAFKPNLGEDLFNKIKELTIESSVEVVGIPKPHPKVEGVYELDIELVKILQISEEYPIAKKNHGPDFLMSNRHLWLRGKKQWATLRIRHTVYYAICDYLNSNGFIRFDSPILTPNACEGTTTLFEVPYFDLGSAYLSQSGQLYLEPGIMSLGKVYDFGPVFRAEKSKTRKHLTEFWMMDAEAAFVEHRENMRIQEELIRFVIRKVINENAKELEILERDIDKLAKADDSFRTITHSEAVKFLQSKGSSICEQDDLGAQDETLISEDSDVPIFIEKWPKKTKPFYMKTDPDNPALVLGNDLIAPEGFGEIIGGSQREDDYDILKSRMLEEKLSMDDYGWYLELRKYGSVPHSGFGIGFERLVCWMAGSPHIRESIPFPRMIHRLYP